MHSHHEEDPEALEHAKRLRWEPRDLGLKGIEKGAWIYIIGTTVGIALSIPILWAFANLLDRGDYRGPSQSEMARESLPKGPLLQTNVSAQADMIKSREREQVQMSTYGKDPDTGAMRMPIDKAIDEVAKRGLPTGGTP